jgi:hypothetical protein
MEDQTEKCNDSLLVHKAHSQRKLESLPD